MFSRASKCDFTALKHNRPSAEMFHGGHIVANKQYSSPLTCDTLNRPEALALKSHVAHRQNFIDEKDFRLQVCRNCKGKPHVHSTGIPFHGRVYKLLDFGKRNDLIKLALDLRLLHPQYGAIKVNVFTSRQFWMKSGTHF